MVQPQRLDRRATARGQPNDVGRIITPDEMFLPSLLPRVKQSNRFTAVRINPYCLGLFVSITGRTGEAQVLDVTCSTL